jgi:rhodanese-related sulfurtransferase
MFVLILIVILFYWTDGEKKKKLYVVYCYSSHDNYLTNIKSVVLDHQFKYVIYCMLSK